MGKLSFLRIHSGRIDARHDPGQPPDGQDRQAGPPLQAPGQDAGGGQRGDRRRHRRDREVRRPAHLRHGLHRGQRPGRRTLKLDPIKFPTPMVPRAVEPKTREDEPKISVGLTKIADEDPTFTFRRDAQTHELVISGMSELHLDVIQHRLKNRYKVDINTHVPHVPYRETIAGEAEAHHRHKKQTGGRGQFAEVHLRIRPRARARGSTSSTRSRAASSPTSSSPRSRRGSASSWRRASSPATRSSTSRRRSSSARTTRSTARSRRSRPRRPTPSARRSWPPAPWCSSRS